MAQIIILGSANAVPDEHQENTHLAILEGERTVLVDCAGSVITRLQQAKIALDSIQDIILTHFHPDHVGGAPLLLMGMWLLGRTAPLTLHGLGYTLERFERMMALYDWRQWPGFYPVKFHRVAEAAQQTILDDPGLSILSSPVKHLVPTIGLRIAFPRLDKVVAYSCDTEPCAQVAQLAAGADLLIHEATGASVGHSSARQAGEIAREAEARRLWLIHYTPAGHNGNAHNLINEASQAFSGEVRLARDFQQIDLESL